MLSAQIFERQKYEKKQITELLFVGFLFLVVIPLQIGLSIFLS